MRTVVADMSKAVYDSVTDVMYFNLGMARFTDEEEVAPGIHVLYAFDGHRLGTVSGVEIEYFAERFGDAEAIDIPADSPFVLRIPAGIRSAIMQPEDASVWAGIQDANSLCE